MRAVRSLAVDRIYHKCGRLLKYLANKIYSLENPEVTTLSVFEARNLILSENQFFKQNSSSKNRENLHNTQLNPPISLPKPCFSPNPASYSISM